MKHILLITLLLGFSAQALSACLGTPNSFATPDPRDQSPWVISSREYLPTLTATPVLFILPTILGESKLERQMAYSFCRAGLAVYILNTVRPVAPETTTVDWASNDYVLIRAKVAVSAAITELDQTGKFSGVYGMVGSSLGAIQTAYVHGSEPRIKASVIVAGGGNMPGIQSHSLQANVVTERKNRMNILGTTDVTVFETLMKQNLNEDPLKVAAAIPANSISMYIALKDTSVPTQYQQELRQAIASPVVVEVDNNHVGTIQNVTYYNFKDMLAFFKARL
jgi:hypothetical protein